ncbi:hypothetical protein LTR84_000742 [Exophiala bonariae]|uniref:Protein kinase domain-containing protein n=1 Tax=Exophiala bonariae TaxID=1690606 RepID=A0AAV9NVG7_9EURO|nr:hypothetical protein LTR84_000742 [Exophiala bonariae]
MASSRSLSPGDATPVAEFLHFLSKHQSPGLRFGSSLQKCMFVPQDELQAYLSGARLQALLESVCRQRFTQKDVNTAAVQSRRRILAILILIGRGDLIKRCFTAHAPSDENLPFELQPSQFSFDTFRRFYEEQWAFCAHSFQEGEIDSHILENTILPIYGLEEKDLGGPQPLLSCGYIHTTSVDTRCVHEFVIKTYNLNGDLASISYRNELEALKTLSLNKNASKSIVKFYGSFTQQDSHHVILEYADQGTLRDFYQKFSHPKMENDVTDFWEHLFNLAVGLRQIHHIELLEGDHTSTFHGVHQDLRPSNILVFCKGEASPYRFTFKIGNFSHSHYGLSDEDNSKNHGGVSMRIRTYGPPGCYLIRPAYREVVRAQRNGDIWSLACIFSEATSWVTDGPQAVEEYRNQRKQALSQVPGFKDGDCFHDGSDVLPEVKAWHAHLAMLRRAGDYVTPNIWHTLLQQCLEVDEQRLRAFQLCNKTIELLGQQRNRVCHDYFYRGDDNNKGWPPAGRFCGSSGPAMMRANQEKPSEDLDSMGTTALDVPNPPTAKKSEPNSNNSPGSSTLSTPPNVNPGIEFEKPLCPVHQHGPAMRLPELSFKEVSDWISRRKSFTLKKDKDNEKLPNHDYLNRVAGRDHIFLIDDAVSMKDYWPEVAKVFKALSYLTKTVDDDRIIEAHFTVSAATHKSSKSSILLSKVQERGLQLAATSNPETACDKILREWKNKVTRNKFRNLVGLSKPSMPGVTLYILTDGVWEDQSDLSSFIRDVVRFMDEYDMPRKHIGIQFIRFGNSTRGAERLRVLDSGLGLRRDIVDTIPSTGNVFKILLGPVDPTFDDDECTCGGEANI